MKPRNQVKLKCTLEKFPQSKVIVLVLFLEDMKISGTQQNNSLSCTDYIKEFTTKPGSIRLVNW